MTDSPISTFIVTREKSNGAKIDVLKEFAGRDEFKITLVNYEPHILAKISLWKTIKYIIENLTNHEDEFIIICEDYHQFTEHYQKDFLLKCIEQADKMNADILSGGVSVLQHFVRVSPEIFWMSDFLGLQFTIVYRRFFKTISTLVFGDEDMSDLKISTLTENKFFIYPFISVQKEFGESDIKPLNNNEEKVDQFLDRAFETIKYVDDVLLFYKQQRKELTPIDATSYENFYIPTYIINLPERKDRLTHIKKQFEGKDEFDIRIIEAIKHQKGNLGLWLTIRKIVEQAIIDDHDIIIICEDDHEFTEHYVKDCFISDVIETHALGAGMLLGGVGYFNCAALISKNKFWVGGFYCTQFTVIYKSLFQRILDQPFDEKVAADGVFSKMTSNKLSLFPFISIQRFLGRSNINDERSRPGFIDQLFKSSHLQLEQMKKITDLYPCNNS